MGKRFLFLLMLAFSFAGLKAQISYSGLLPLVERTEGCEPIEPMDSEEAFEYLNQFGEFTSPDDCGLFYYVECLISDVVTTEQCYFTLIRTFVVSDACENTLELNQMIFVYYNDDLYAGETLPPTVFDAFAIEDFLPNATESIDEYLAEYNVEYPWCWNDHEVSYTAVATGENDDCSINYQLTFTANPIGCEQKLILFQDVVLAPSGLVTCSSDRMETYTMISCDPEDFAMGISNIEVFDSYGVHFDDYLFPEAFTITYEDVFDENSPCGTDIVMRTYNVKYLCTNQEFLIQQEIHYKSVFSASGHLKPIFYEDVPPEPLTYAELDELLDIHYTCGRENVEITYEDVQDEDNQYVIERKYHVYGECDSMEEIISQYLFKSEDKPVAFSLAYHEDVSTEGAEDGLAGLNPPTYNYYCPDCLNEENRMFIVEWTNLSTNPHRVYRSNPDDPECNIYDIDGLASGSYCVKVYPNCPSLEYDASEPLFVDYFNIKEQKTKLLISPWACLYSTHTYLQVFGMHVTEDASDEACPGIGQLLNHPLHPMTNNIYTWELDDGEILGDWYEMYNPYMGGNGFYERCLMYRDHYDAIIAKDAHSGVYYRAFRADGTLLKEKYKPLYEEKLYCSDDPNEIFGPTGYGENKMINATDNVNYTIMFENDPELATAAAARVKVTCPLDDKLDPTTFRLGSFGFNNMTFEVPELSSYYNNRLMIDSLGYWIDVTASVQVPENEAYWIFQTIDPETGVAPIDSLGFLPVNDTLTGCGEGWVTFTAALRNDSRSIHTGDSIVENAQIFFDENDVVPTNDYCNYFDAVAPETTIVCDTNGVCQTHELPIRFVAHDDEGGSGIKYVLVYGNFDNNGYDIIGYVHPDSVFVYPTNSANLLQFFSQGVDNTGNVEPLKTLPELTYTAGQVPLELTLSNNQFEENASIYTAIGEFSTLDDQTSDDFVYQLVSGEGSTDNISFSIQGNRLVTNRDFRCYGMYDYNIRVRTTDLSGLFLEKAFTIHANRTEEVAPVTVYESICPGESIIFGNERITAEGSYEHTFSNYLGCDSLVYMNVTMNEVAPTAYYEGDICRNYGYDEHGFDLSAETIATLTQGWSMASDTTIFVDNYKDNAFGCTDTLRLALTVKPAFDIEDNHLVCPSDLPYVYKNRPYVSDTTVLFSYTNRFGCDSIVRFNLTLNPDYGTQSDALANGWSWYSTYIDQSNGKGLKNLESALGNKAENIKSQLQFVQYYPEQDSWYGNLLSIDNESMYMIQNGSPNHVDVTGCYADANACEIGIHHGWNWIGYPSVYTTSVESAMSGMNRNPKDGDILKSQSNFTMYYEDFGMWYGPLSMLSPGEGYMYLSNDNDDKTLVYPANTRNQGTPVDMQEVHWQSDEHQFARNITFVGAIELDGNIIESDTLEVGVFCQGEQRGSGRAIYLDKLGEYRIFLTAHGDEGDELNFCLYDHNKKKERRARSHQREIFHDDDNYGNMVNPYLFVFNTDYDRLIEAEICEGQYYVENGFRAYQSGTYFNELPNDSIIRLDLTVNPVYHEEKSVVAFEFPFHYDGMTFDAPGTYNLQFNSAEECDSTLVLTVQPYDGLRELLISPVPAEKHQVVTLFFPFTEAEQHDMMVEVYTLGGNLMQAIRPRRYPIELEPFSTAGTYMVKITMGTGEVLTGKIIVK